MKTIDFVGNRKKFFIISIAIIILGIIGVIIVGGPTLSIEYQGGAVIEIGVPDNDFSIPEVEKLIQDALGRDVSVQKSEYEYDTSVINKNVNRTMVKLDLRIRTEEHLTSEETAKVSNYLDSKFDGITVPSPKYYEARSPYTAHYEMDCKGIPTDNTESYNNALAEIKKDLENLLPGKKVRTDFSYIFGPGKLVITKYMVNIKVASTEKLLSESDVLTVKNTIADKFDIVVSENPVDYNISNVSPNVGREMLRNGFLAIIIASALMILYIWIRFKVISGLSAGVMSIIALMNDVIIMFLVYVIFRFTINESFISAVLTILGYSINNTIVIFDRVRENINLNSDLPVEKVVNDSLNQSLKRCIITSSCVLSSLIIVYIFATLNGLSTVVEFIFPLIIGAVSGFYSAVFIAPNLWAMYKTKKG